MSEEMKLEYLRELVVKRVEALAMQSSIRATTELQNAQFVGQAGALYEVLEMIDALKTKSEE